MTDYDPILRGFLQAWKEFMYKKRMTGYLTCSEAEYNRLFRRQLRHERRQRIIRTWGKR